MTHELTENDLLDLEIKYKDNDEILILIEIIKNQSYEITTLKNEIYE